MNKYLDATLAFLLLGGIIGVLIWLIVNTSFETWLEDALKAVAWVILYGVVVIIYNCCRSRSIPQNKPAKQKPDFKTAKQIIKNSLNNPGTKLSDLTNSQLGESISKFIRDKKINSKDNMS